MHNPFWTVTDLFTDFIVTLNLNFKLSFLTDVNEESPPEPAPPEVPPRGPSLHSATLRRRNEYALPVRNDGTEENEESQFLKQGGGKSSSWLVIV